MLEAFVKKYGLVIFALVLIGLFSILSPEIFATRDNFTFILKVNAALTVLALGSIVALAAGEFDLTVAAVAGLSAIVVARLGQVGVPFIAAIAIAIACGLLVALINALAVNVLKVSSLITTLAMLSVVSGFTLFLTGGATVSSGVPSGLVDFMQGSVQGIPYSTFVVAVIALLVWYLLSRTPLGRTLYAMGMNREASRLMGASIKRNVTISFMISSTAAVAAGIMLLGSQQAASPSLGSSLLLPALAVAFLGASTIQPGWFNVGGTLVAVLLVGSSIVGLQSIGVPYWVEPIFFGAVLIAAVAVAATNSTPFFQWLTRSFKGDKAQREGSEDIVIAEEASAENRRD